MGNCHKKEFVQDENTYEGRQNTMVDEILRSMANKKDQLLEIIEQYVHPKNLKNISQKF
jgi:hypothetical protein